MHLQSCKTEYVINYIIYKLKLFFDSSANLTNATNTL